MTRIYYRKGNWKYQLARDYGIQLRFKPEALVHHEFFMFDTLGFLSIKSGYAWDGPSGPTIDTDSAMRGSLVHDVGYQMIGMGALSLDYRDEIDYTFYDILREDGMLDFRAWAWCRAVRRFGEGPAKSPEPEILVSPRPKLVTVQAQPRIGMI